MLKILLPFDGSEASLNSVRHALQLVRSGLTASFVLANVQTPATLYEWITLHDPEAIEQLSEAVAARVLAPAEALLNQAKVEWERAVANGDPGHVLAEMIELHGVDAVIMGARGLGAAKGLLVGSVSQWLLQHAAVPVTVVHPSAADDD